MKKIYFLLILLSCVATSLTVSAQQPGYPNTDTASIKLQINEGKRAQNFYVELLGQGLWFTANYDTRFNNKRDGLGGRIGIGLGPSWDFDLFADEEDIAAPVIVPLSLNYLLGNGSKHFFEIGLGATFISGQEGGLIGTSSFAYRLQPLNNGFTFRASLNPIYSDSEFFPLFGGISLGYTF